MKPQNVLVLNVPILYLFQSLSRELWGNIQDLSSLAEVSKEDPEEKAEF